MNASISEALAPATTDLLPYPGSEIASVQSRLKIVHTCR
jgi:hypothetical protein